MKSKPKSRNTRGGEASLERLWWCDARDREEQAELDHFKIKHDTQKSKKMEFDYTLLFYIFFI